MAEQIPGDQQDQRVNIATAIAEVSERASLLIREEIELAKAEVTEKATRLAKGAVVGVAAGIFVVTAIFFILIGLAWLLYFELPIGNDFTYFWGFFAMALILLILGGIAGFIAAKAVKAGSPPTPKLAFEEARKTREMVSASAAQSASSPDPSVGRSAGAHGPAQRVSGEGPAQAAYGQAPGQAAPGQDPGQQGGS